MKRFFIMFFILIFASSMFASTEFSGQIDLNYSAGLKKGEEYRKYLKLDLNLTQTFNETEIVAILRAEEDSIRIDEPERVYLRQVYLNQDIYFNKFINSINFKLGKIIYTWGNADELKPVDILNPQDLSFLLFKPINERKYGLFSLDLSLFFTENIFLEAVAIPEFKNSEYDISKIFVMKELKKLKEFGYQISDPVLPNENLHNCDYAARFGVEIFKIDTHLIYFKGYDRLPVFQIQPSFVVTPVYKKIEMFGFDFQRALFSGWSVRGEIAYFSYGKFFELKNENLSQNLISGGNGNISKKYLEYTFGFDVTDLFINNLYLNLQINGNYIFDYVNEIKNEKNVNSILGTVEYSFFREKIKEKLRGFYNLNEKAYAVGYETGLKISQNSELNIGLWIFEGDKDTYYGQFKENDFAYISAKVLF